GAAGHETEGRRDVVERLADAVEPGLELLVGVGRVDKVAALVGRLGDLLPAKGVRDERLELLGVARQAEGGQQLAGAGSRAWGRDRSRRRGWRGRAAVARAGGERHRQQASDRECSEAVHEGAISGAYGGPAARAAGEA